MAHCLQRVAGLCVRAVSCALLLGACRVYDRDALSSRVSAVESDADHSAQRSAAVAACEDGGAPCDDDCAAVSCELPHADSVCRAGQCQLARCSDGYRDCDGEADNGCEVEPDAVEHCGQCQRGCGSVEHGSARCVAGRCEMSGCDTGFADCDKDGRSCEVELMRDAQHCGSCEQPCRFLVEQPNAAALCRDGRCQLRCQRGFGDCDGDFANGCERALSTTSDCGGCGQACVIEHASAQCHDGHCEVASCEAGFGDCDADGSSCERELSDISSCGACEQRCELAHAQARCAAQGQDAHACQIEHCDKGFSDCDGAAANGCERDVRPVADGGEGGCAPDGDCQAELFDDRQYFFCQSARTWDDARATCKTQRNGDLAQLRDAATQTFLRRQLNGHAWASHNDLLAEGTWIWANSNVQFWRGGANGRAMNGEFVRWSRDEPDDTGRCGSLTADAEMEDLACTVLQAFVCEISPDLCPEDPRKSHPGQCGCGKLDTDANQDGLAECPR